MEKTNKYYKIIENLVKQNNKFTGYEAIIEDIIDDVYSHSEVVLNSISNEDVIKAYLNKVVSTSIITVPKKLNFHKELSHAVINKNLNYNITNNQTKETDINTALIDQMINGTKSESQKPILKEEDMNKFVIDENVDDKDFQLENDLVPNDSVENLHINEAAFIGNSNNILEDLSHENNTISDIELENNERDDLSIEKEAETSEESIISDDSSIDINVQDSIQNEALLEDNIVEIPTSCNENYPQENELENDLLIENNPPEIIEDTNIIKENIVQSENIENILPRENNAQETLIIEETSDFIDSTPMLDEDTSCIPNSIIDINENSELINEEQDEISNEDLLLNLEDNNDELTSFIDVPSDIETLDSNISDLDLNITEEFNTKEERTINIPDYSVFSYKSDKETEMIDAEDIKKDIIEIDTKFPELKIIDVYNLKYKENYSIEEIASKLSMDENNVIDSLNEIISVI